ncbi:unnamed protein product, partial [marine sediment metagenome]
KESEKKMAEKTVKEIEILKTETKIWRLFVAGEKQGDFTSLQIMAFMHEVVYNSEYRTIEFALIDNTDNQLK